MFKTLANAWKLPDLRKKIIFTMLILLIYRIGNVVAVPFVDTNAMSQYFNSSLNSTILGLYNAMSGSAFSRASVLALGIQPYINASIIIQLLTVAIPALERLAKEGGEEGKKKIERITRYSTVAMWMGEQITEHGIGNGISMILFANIIAGIPTGISTLLGIKWWISLIIVAVMAAMIVFIIFINDAERRIPIQYAKRVVGRKIYGGQNTNLPIKVSMSGVMPIIFAQSICSMPATICAFVPSWTNSWLNKNVFASTSVAYAIFYALMIFFFSWFYSTIQYDPVEVANNLQKNGGFIPGFRPGKATATFIQKVIGKIVIFGAIYLTVIAILPIIAGNILPNVAGLAIGGTSVIIVVGVALETVKALEAQMLMRHYKGFLD